MLFTFKMKIRVKIFFASSLVACCLFFAAAVNAADLFFEAKSQEFAQGEEFIVNILLNTEGESINAIEGKIVFPDKLLEAKEIRDGNSIINFWIKQPDTSQYGVVNFSGIIPGGYNEAKGFIFSIVFQVKAEGSGAVEISDAGILLNNGKGTPANVKISPFRFSISKENLGVLSEIQTTKDLAPPENFKPEISNSPDLFNGKWFLAFATQDKGSGIAYYKVCEGSKTKCVIAESPYVLQNQNLDQVIFVKAVDRNGNERIEDFYPAYWHPWYKNYWIFGILIMGGIFIFYIFIKDIWKKFIKSR